MTATVSCPPGPYHPGAAPGMNLGGSGDTPHTHTPHPGGPRDSPGSLAAGQHQVSHQEHGTAKRDSRCQPHNPHQDQLLGWEPVDVGAQTRGTGASRAPTHYEA